MTWNVPDGRLRIMGSETFANLPRGHYGAILADPPWHFQAWASPPYGKGRAAESHYDTMKEAELNALPVADLAAPDCVLFMWACWPMIEQAFRTIDAWGFKFKTCAAADVRQAIIAPKREHSRKPDGIHERVERLVAGPYLELFARQRRPNWDVWGNQTDKFAEAAE